MTAEQIAVRKNLYRRVRRLSEYETAQVMAFIDGIENHEPNAETVAAIRELESGGGTRYESAGALFKDLGI